MKKKLGSFPSVLPMEFFLQTDRAKFDYIFQEVSERGGYR